jgi:hypothetical protein
MEFRDLTLQLLKGIEFIKVCKQFRERIVYLAYVLSHSFYLAPKFDDTLRLISPSDHFAVTIYPTGMAE